MSGSRGYDDPGASSRNPYRIWSPDRTDSEFEARQTQQRSIYTGTSGGTGGRSSSRHRHGYTSDGGITSSTVPEAYRYRSAPTSSREPLPPAPVTYATYSTRPQQQRAATANVPVTPQSSAVPHHSRSQSERLPLQALDPRTHSTRRSSADNGDPKSYNDVPTVQRSSKSSLYVQNPHTTPMVAPTPTSHAIWNPYLQGQNSREERLSQKKERDVGGSGVDGANRDVYRDRGAELEKNRDRDGHGERERERELEEKVRRGRIDRATVPRVFSRRDFAEESAKESDSSDSSRLKPPYTSGGRKYHSADAGSSTPNVARHGRILSQPVDAPSHLRQSTPSQAIVNQSTAIWNPLPSAAQEAPKKHRSYRDRAPATLQSQVSGSDSERPNQVQPNNHANLLRETSAGASGVFFKSDSFSRRGTGDDAQRLKSVHKPSEKPQKLGSYHGRSSSDHDSRLFLRSRESLTPRPPDATIEAPITSPMPIPTIFSPRASASVFPPTGTSGRAKSVPPVVGFHTEDGFAGEAPDVQIKSPGTPQVSIPTGLQIHAFNPDLNVYKAQLHGDMPSTLFTATSQPPVSQAYRSGPSVGLPAEAPVVAAAELESSRVESGLPSVAPPIRASSHNSGLHEMGVPATPIAVANDQRRSSRMQTSRLPLEEDPSLALTMSSQEQAQKRSSQSRLQGLSQSLSYPNVGEGRSSGTVSSEHPAAAANLQGTYDLHSSRFPIDDRASSSMGMVVQASPAQQVVQPLAPHVQFYHIPPAEPGNYSSRPSGVLQSEVILASSVPPSRTPSYNAQLNELRSPVRQEQPSVTSQRASPKEASKRSPVPSTSNIVCSTPTTASTSMSSPLMHQSSSMTSQSPSPPEMSTIAPHTHPDNIPPYPQSSSYRSAIHSVYPEVTSALDSLHSERKPQFTTSNNTELIQPTATLISPFVPPPTPQPSVMAISSRTPSFNASAGTTPSDSTNRSVELGSGLRGQQDSEKQSIRSHLDKHGRFPLQADSLFPTSGISIAVLPPDQKSNPYRSSVYNHFSSPPPQIAAPTRSPSVSSPANGYSSMSYRTQVPLGMSNNVIRPPTGSASITSRSHPPSKSQSASTRVAVSGPPSTPASVQVALKELPQPLTPSPSPESDILKTPSSLNPSLKSPRHAPTYMAVPQIEEPRKKGGIFSFFRSSKPPPEKQHEVWTSPLSSRTSDPRRDQMSATVSNSRSRSGQNLTDQPPLIKKSTRPIPVNLSATGRKSPASKMFSPLRLFSHKRHRTVSAASLEAVDGTANNTVLNSPASSRRSPTPGIHATPPPAQRDPLTAAHEWRNKEEADLREREKGGKPRRRRPGVTFQDMDDDSSASGEGRRPVRTSKLKARRR